MVVTFQEALEEQKALGLEKGRKAGHLEALQNAVLRSIEQRFPSAPPTVEKKVRRIRNLDRLYALLARVIEARSLADLALA